jgi:molybdate transport system ATP-binding protein
MSEKFLELRGVSIPSGSGGSKLLDGVNLVIREGEQWAIVGSSGSGKTILANTLAGKHFYTGDIDYYFPLNKNGQNTILVVQQQHRFKGLSHTNDLYYQQRFNSYDAEQTITVQEELQQRFPAMDCSASEWLDLLHIRSLLDEPLIQLSNGEHKRVQLCLALLQKPMLLILDSPFTGLDHEGRNILHIIIGLIAGKGVHVLLITSFHEIPDKITHIAFLDRGRLQYAGKKENFQSPLPVAEKNNAPDEWWEWVKTSTVSHFRMAVRLVNVHVRYGDKQILEDINWEVKKAECWSLSGPNGAGKSTLLSLITADNPQAYANEIYLFDRRRGSGESIWDIKKKIGFVSPELHLYFDYSATCFEVIASGFFDTIGLFRRLSGEQQENVTLWLKLFQLENLQAKRFSDVSASEQRKTLLARALIKSPPLLILDEPCQGLDEEQTLDFKNLINRICRTFGTTLVYVSHYPAQIPQCVDRFIRLENGKIIH